MSDFLTDRTVLGIGGTLVSVGIALWRRLAPPRAPDQPSLYVRFFRAISAIGRLQMAEGDLDYAKESLLWKDQQLHLSLDENQRLAQENERLRSEIGRLTSSPDPVSSTPSTAGYTERRGVRPRKKPTT